MSILRGLLLTVVITAMLSAVTVGANPDTVKVPFKLDRNRIIVPTSVNGSKPLNLILDTGMRFDGVYLFHKEFAELMDTTGAVEVRVPGAGAEEASTAVMIETGRLAFGDVTVDSQRVLISGSDHTQKFPTDGCFGWNFFGHYAVEIDYDQMVITLHDTASFQAEDDWQILPVTMIKDLPFFECEVEVIDGETVPITVYIDLSSGDALELLVRDDQKFSMPDSTEKRYLGTGLSGDIHGEFGRSKRLRIASFDLLDIPTAFAPAEVRSKQEGADAILGNNSIRRFNIVFDYTRSRLCVKPNTHFDEAFE